MPRHGRFTSGKVTRYRSCKRLGRLQGRSGRVWKISPPPGFDPRTAQPADSRYTDYAMFSKHTVFKHTSKNTLAFALKTKVRKHTHTHTFYLFNNQPDALIIQIYSVIKLYMFRATSLPTIRSSLLYIRHW